MPFVMLLGLEMLGSVKLLIVRVPSVVIEPIELFPALVIHIWPSGPATMLVGRETVSSAKLVTAAPALPIVSASIPTSGTATVADSSTAQTRRLEKRPETRIVKPPGVDVRASLGSALREVNRVSYAGAAPPRERM